MPINIVRIDGLIATSSKRKLRLLTSARVAANLLDLLGLAGVALLAQTFGTMSLSGEASAPGGELFGFAVDETVAIGIAVLVSAIFLAKSVFSIGLNLVTSSFIAKIETDLSTTLARAFFSSFMGESEKNQDTIADFQTRAIQSTSAIGSYLNARITFFAELTLLLATVGVFFFVNPIAAVALLTLMSLILLTLIRLINARLTHHGDGHTIAVTESLESSRALFSVIKEVGLRGATDLWIKKFSNSRGSLAHHSARLYVLHSLPRFVIESSLILGLFAFIGGVVLFSDLQSQAVTIGVFLAGGLRLIASLLPLQNAVSLMQDSAARARSAIELLTQPANPIRPRSAELSVLPKAPKSEQPAVEFDNVSFTFPGSLYPSIRNVSFKIPVRSKFAIVGRSGAGKTTLIDLMTGFLNPSSGDIRLFGTEVGEYGNVHGAVGLVPQRPHLVRGTLADNISLTPGEETDPELILQLLQSVGLDHLGSDPGWRDQVFDPELSPLSGGEMQRLGLARALYTNPEILILDEATSALDAETEDQISSLIDGLRDQMAVIVIAHRLSTVRNADRIIYLEKGEIRGIGTHEELRQSIPEYANALRLLGIQGE